MMIKVILLEYYSFIWLTRYSQLNISTNGYSISTKEWHQEDPVDDFERNRNDVLI